MTATGYRTLLTAYLEIHNNEIVTSCRPWQESLRSATIRIQIAEYWRGLEGSKPSLEIVHA